MSHPYTKHEGTETWGIIKKSIRSLVKNSDLSLETNENYVIGYLCQQLFEKSQRQWFAGEKMEGVEFYLNDPIEIVGDENKGSKGSVISLEAMEPEPMYLVELSGGEDVYIKQSCIKNL